MHEGNMSNMASGGYIGDIEAVSCFTASKTGHGKWCYGHGVTDNSWATNLQ